MLTYTLHEPGVVYHDADETDRGGGGGEMDWILNPDI